VVGDPAAPHIAFVIRQMHATVPITNPGTADGGLAAAAAGKEDEPMADSAAGRGLEQPRAVVIPAEVPVSAVDEQCHAKEQTNVPPVKDHQANASRPLLPAEAADAATHGGKGSDRGADDDERVLPADSDPPATVAEVVDWEAAARAAVASGEWKETLDAKKRMYYFHAKEKKSCWNLAKELEKRSAAARSVKGVTGT
jgi:hypothetical protein